MKTAMMTILLSAGFASAAFAQDEGMAADTLTCADFLAMDVPGRAEAVETVQSAAAEGGMASDEMAEGEMAAEGEMMAEDDMMAEDEMAAEGGMMAEGDMAAEGEMMADDAVAAVVEVCERDLNVRLADAVDEATGH